MSIQFGLWNFDGRPPDPEILRQAAQLAGKYGPVDQASWLGTSVAMAFQSFYTTTQSKDEIQPLVEPSGLVLTWDGRLDNRKELIALLNLHEPHRQSDAGIVMTAYMRWGTACFDKLLGDWAAALWDPTKQTLLFAKDFVGVRHLFYALERNRVMWCTVLDPLVFLGQRPLTVNEKFVAGYLSTHPETHVTPYVEINAVPASTFVLVQPGRASVGQHSQFDPSLRIRYRTDTDYEHHFRQVFGDAVRRRLRSSWPVLAELSGGMDSTSIVCMADTIIAHGQAATPRLDTVSYYDDEEPNWNEKPYFSLVEKKRGRQGYHIEIGSTAGALEPPGDAVFLPFPGSDKWNRDWARTLGRCLRSSGSRVLLSGIGGDEFLAGVPTPIPELQNLLARMRWLQFWRQLMRWSLEKRLPWAHLCFAVVEEFLPQGIRRLYKDVASAPWLSRTFVRGNRKIFWADTLRTKPIGPLPSFQAAIATLNHVRRQLGCSHLKDLSHCRVTYPYLDRDLLTFLFAIPREQLSRPGIRRSLMRRALVDLVPAEIFARKRKAFLARNPLKVIESALPKIQALQRSPLTVTCKWLDPKVLAELPAAIKQGQLSHPIALLNLVRLDLWLQQPAAPDSFTSSYELTAEVPNGMCEDAGNWSTQRRSYKESNRIQPFLG